MIPFRTVSLILFAVASQIRAEPLEKPPGIRIGVVEDFEREKLGPYQKGFLDSWSWSAETREQARLNSSLEVVAEGEGKCLKVRVSAELPFVRGVHKLFSLAPYFPPEADAVRMRVLVLSGSAKMFLGGPTAYYGNSDVFTKVHDIPREPRPKWVSVEFSLNQELSRNNRRAGFSMDAPRNYYNRWAQEPLGVYIAEGTEGEFLIDEIELIRHRKGKPFPVFKPEDVKLIKTIADFEDGNLNRIFNLYMADAETEWFEQSWKRERPLRFPPTMFSIVDTEIGGGKCLSCSRQAAEEVHCTGIKTEGAVESNALSVNINRSAAARGNTLVGVGPAEAMDFLIFVAPVTAPFPWDSLGASEELRKLGTRGFDYQFSYKAIRDRADLDIAVYQARRYVKPGEWSTLIIPFADFTCIHGAGAYRQRFTKRESLTSDEIIAVAWLNPWNRTGNVNSPVITRLDDLALVRVPGESPELRSFWQKEPLR